MDSMKLFLSIVVLILSACAAPPPVKIVGKLIAKSFVKKPKYCGVDYDNQDQGEKYSFGDYLYGNFYPETKFQSYCGPKWVNPATTLDSIK